MKFNNPNRLEQENYLIRLYFGDKSDYLEMCIDRAYRDFNRTLHGIKDHPAIYESAKSLITESLRTLSQSKSKIQNKAAFDMWHKNLCMMLREHYEEQGFVNYHVGQAQKWINMSLKYVFTMGQERLPNYSHLYEFCHIPLDNIIIKKLSTYKPPLLTCAWSRVDNYDEYMAFQNWVRSYFCESTPLAVEFFLWLQE